MTRGQPPAQPVGGSEQSFSSTTWTWQRVKVRRAPQATQDSRPKGVRWHRLPRWPVRKPLHLTIKYRGGAEGWVEVHARGQIGRFPGHVAVLDLMREVWNESDPR